MPPNAVPGLVWAYTAPPIAASSAKMLKWPNACEARLCRRGSSTINAVPITVRMISGRNRTRSVALAPKLTGMRYLRLLLQWAGGPRNFMKKWGSLDVAGGLGSTGSRLKPAAARIGRPTFSTLAQLHPLRHVDVGLFQHPRRGL